MIVSVSQLNKYIFFRFKEDEQLKKLTVRGEISNFTKNLRSGHCYFTLKDADSSIRAVMFAGYAANLDFAPAAGMSVVVKSDVTVYERDGTYQLLVSAMSLDGVGNSLVAFEQLKNKLEKEGLFEQEHKLPLPDMPRRIGAVTSPTGAAIRDIINIISRRYPVAELIVFPALVQGDEAPSSICKAIETASKADCDVLIVGRGGGSAEDLSCFNAESVVRAVYNCPVPIISAVGHETDFTLCDFAADLRAPTPSAAAELVSPDISAMIQQLDKHQLEIKSAYATFYERREIKLMNLLQRLDYLSPSQRIERMDEHIKRLSKELSKAAQKHLNIAQDRLSMNLALLESLSPLRVFARGYCASYKDGSLISSVKTIKSGDKLDINFSDGKINATVDFVEKL